jgi:hypothetical protein
MNHMSNRLPGYQTPVERGRAIYRAARRGEPLSPLLIIVLLVAAFTCLFLCAIGVLIPLQLLFR